MRHIHATPLLPTNKKKRLFSFCCIGVVFKFQVAFYEILNELWVRNGLQIKGQAMTYIQCNFCNSMVDADLYLLQIACSRTCPNEFVTLIINSYVFLLSIQTRSLIFNFPGFM
jgi:hypothetical protein